MILLKIIVGALAFALIVMFISLIYYKREDQHWL